MRAESTTALRYALAVMRHPAWLERYGVPVDALGGEALLIFHAVADLTRDRVPITLRSVARAAGLDVYRLLDLHLDDHLFDADVPRMARAIREAHTRWRRLLACDSIRMAVERGDDLADVRERVAEVFA